MKVKICGVEGELMDLDAHIEEVQIGARYARHITGYDATILVEPSKEITFRGILPDEIEQVH